MVSLWIMQHKRLSFTVITHKKFRVIFRTHSHSTMRRTHLHRKNGGWGRGGGGAWQMSSCRLNPHSATHLHLTEHSHREQLVSSTRIVSEDGSGASLPWWWAGDVIAVIRGQKEQLWTPRFKQVFACACVQGLGVDEGVFTATAHLQHTLFNSHNRDVALLTVW